MFDLIFGMKSSDIGDKIKKKHHYFVELPSNKHDRQLVFEKLIAYGHYCYPSLTGKDGNMTIRLNKNIDEFRRDLLFLDYEHPLPCISIYEINNSRTNIMANEEEDNALEKARDGRES